MSTIALLVSLLAFPPEIAAPHIRSSDPLIQHWLADGRLRSRTFRSLVDAVEAGDVIVHLERRILSARSYRAATRFVTFAGGVKYLRITLDATAGGDAAVALLGHELRHVLEIAAAPWLETERDLRLLLSAIGEPRGALCFETNAAIATGDRVAAELRADRRRAAN